VWSPLWQPSAADAKRRLDKRFKPKMSLGVKNGFLGNTKNKTDARAS
jgi:hypothetical protein